MATNFWNTLVTHDLERTRRFYAALGFQVEDTPVPGGLQVRPGEHALICFFLPESFGNMAPGATCDANEAQEVIQSISVDSRERVDELRERAAESGGRALGEAREMPFGYACGFTDPDGHLWSALWFGDGPG